MIMLWLCIFFNPCSHLAQSKLNDHIQRKTHFEVQKVLKSVCVVHYAYREQVCVNNPYYVSIFQKPAPRWKGKFLVLGVLKTYKYKAKIAIIEGVREHQNRGFQSRRGDIKQGRMSG